MASSAPTQSLRRGAATISPESVLDQQLQAVLGQGAKVTTKVDRVTR